MKLIHALIYLHFLISVTNLRSQNLVPNSSFEEFIDFNQTTPDNWQKVQESDTPDYFNFIQRSNNDNLFERYIGGTEPNSGHGFTGIFCYRTNPKRDIRNVREYIEISLTDTLKKNNLYRVSIAINLDRESNVSVKHFGILFSPDPLTFKKDGKLFSMVPQVEYDLPSAEGFSGWINLQTYYSAAGNEKFIILGNFRDDRSTVLYPLTPVPEKGKKKWNLSVREKAAYLYIDDVVVDQEPEIYSVIPGEDVLRGDTLNITEIEKDSAIILRNIQFSFDSYNLLPQSYDEINKLYLLMKNNPSVKIKLEGHTDNTGSTEYNEKLSLRRVESVARYLIGKGIEPGRIELTGYGFASPVASNFTEEGRALNRRVVFKIVEK